VKAHGKLLQLPRRAGGGSRDVVGLRAMRSARPHCADAPARQRPRSPVWGVAGALLFVAAAVAQTGGSPTGAEALAQALVEAVRSGGAERRLAVVHSSSRRCITAATQPYYDWWFGKQRRVVGAGRPTVKVERFDAASAVLPSDGRSDYPVLPTHRVQIDFADGAQRGSSLLTYVALDGAQWKEVLPCPRGDVVEQARQRGAEEREQSARVRSQLAQMPAALRRELHSLLAEGRKVDAIRRYADASGEDLSTAKAVVEALGAAAAR
jgi:hypothetical protein